MIDWSTSAWMIVDSGSSYSPSSSLGSRSAARKDHLGVLLGHPVVAHHPGLDAGAAQLAQQLQADVGHDLDVHPRVVVDLQPGDGIDVGGVPERLQRRVVIGPVDHVAECAVAAGRQRDAHVPDGLGGRHAGAALGAHADRLARFGVGAGRDRLGLGCGVFVGAHVRKPSRSGVRLVCYLCIGMTRQPKANAS
jgi:hypothetical protein